MWFSEVLWFIWSMMGLLSGFGKNSLATSRCIDLILHIPSRFSVIVWYVLFLCGREIQPDISLTRPMFDI